MSFSEEFLRALCDGRVSGGFPPFDAGNIGEVEAYVKHILGAVNARRDLIVKADFDSYGSGFASYVSVRISKKDKSDTRIKKNGEQRIEWTDGLLLYVSKLVPFWFWGGSDWTINYEGERETGGAGGFLSPESAHDVNRNLWESKIGRIEKIFADFGYVLLKENELNEPLWFDVKIPTILAGERYRVFDCFFYWED